MIAYLTLFSIKACDTVVNSTGGKRWLLSSFSKYILILRNAWRDRQVNHSFAMGRKQSHVRCVVERFRVLMMSYTESLLCIIMYGDVMCRVSIPVSILYFVSVFGSNVQWMQWAIHSVYSRQHLLPYTVHVTTTETNTVCNWSLESPWLRSICNK